MILGFDISTSCSGICVLENDGSFVDVQYVLTKDIESYYEKVDAIIFALRNSYKIVSGPQIYVEGALGASNNQNVVNKLQRINGMACYALYLEYGIEPILIKETEARKLNGIKVPKGVKGENKKKYCLQFVRDLAIIPESKWEFKRTGNPKTFCYDMADSYLVAKAGYLNETR